MSKKPCHTILFSFRVGGPQSWVLRVTKLSCFLRYPHDTSHLLYFFMYKWILITYCSVWYNRRWASLMGNAILNIMLSVLIGRFQHVHICKIQLSDGTRLPLIVSLHYALAYLKSLPDNIDKWVISMPNIYWDIWHQPIWTYTPLCTNSTRITYNTLYYQVLSMYAHIRLMNVW